MLSSARPRTAQLVVISGRNTPSAEYSVGEIFCSTISTNCTSDAITRINAIVLRNSRPSGTSSACHTKYVIIPASVITNVTAIPIPKAVSTCLDTPRKGQIPRKRESTKLLTRMALTTIIRILAFSILMCPLPMQPFQL